jgi:hypothetical protein
LFSFLADNGYTAHVFNPIQTDGRLKGTEIRKRKTNIIDSVLIADAPTYFVFIISLTNSICLICNFIPTINSVWKQGDGSFASFGDSFSIVNTIKFIQKVEQNSE